VVANQSKAAGESATRAVSKERTDRLPQFSSGYESYMVKKGDNYAIIAAKFGVDEAELRKFNRGVDIRAGLLLRIPLAKRIVAVEPAEVEKIRNQATPNESESGLVEIPLTPNTSSNAVNQSKAIPKALQVGAAGKTHTIKSGETVWKISKQYNLTEKELMSLNGISDPNKIRAGQVLKIP
jgi:LysM repeat protein